MLTTGLSRIHCLEKEYPPIVRDGQVNLHTLCRAFLYFCLVTEDEEREEEEYENDFIEAMVKASVKEDEEAAEIVAAQDDADDEDDEEELMTADTPPNTPRGGRSYSMYETMEEDEDTAVVDYRDWYDNMYLPWYANWEREMNEYKLKMLKYEAAHYQVSNPFGDVTFGNPYPFYSEASYRQSLYDDVKKSKGPKVKYQKEYDEWKTSSPPPTVGPIPDK